MEQRGGLGIIWLHDKAGISLFLAEYFKQTKTLKGTFHSNHWPFSGVTNVKFFKPF